jgi:hypothetical protein
MGGIVSSLPSFLTHLPLLYTNTKTIRTTTLKEIDEKITSFNGKLALAKELTPFDKQIIYQHVDTNTGLYHYNSVWKFIINDKNVYLECLIKVYDRDRVQSASEADSGMSPAISSTLATDGAAVSPSKLSPTRLEHSRIGLEEKTSNINIAECTFLSKNTSINNLPLCKLFDNDYIYKLFLEDERHFDFIELTLFKKCADELTKSALNITVGTTNPLLNTVPLPL